MHKQWMLYVCISAFSCHPSPSNTPLTPSQTPHTSHEEPHTAVFSEGPYGFNIKDTAGDFTLPTTRGDWDFKKQWTGSDAHILVFFHKKQALSNALYGSSLAELLSTSPQYVHYYFIAYQDIEQFVPWMQQQLEQAIVSQDGTMQKHWLTHTHLVTSEASELTGWIGDHTRAKNPIVYAIAPDQTVRETGYLASVTSSAQPSFAALAHTAEQLIQEQRTQESLASLNATALTVFSQQQVPPGWAASIKSTVTLPRTTTPYNTMHVELAMDCPQHEDAQCPQWDHLAFLYLCDTQNPTQCTTEIARWVSPYHREGRWVTDISPMLAHLSAGSTYTLQFLTHQPFIITLTLWMSHTQDQPTPTQATPLFTGGAFNETYNTAHPALAFNVPPQATKVVFYALLTGHGWGQDTANCAEFCNHQHVFTLNNTHTFRFEHPEAGTAAGCMQKIDDGVVANQYGTWPYGRSGWCPGMDVKPHSYDITAYIQKGASNTLAYEGLFRNKVYVPQTPNNPNSQGFAAEINLSSYVVMYE